MPNGLYITDIKTSYTCDNSELLFSCLFLCQSVVQHIYSLSIHRKVSPDLEVGKKRGFCDE